MPLDDLVVHVRNTIPNQLSLYAYNSKISDSSQRPFPIIHVIDIKSSGLSGAPGWLGC